MHTTLFTKWIPRSLSSTSSYLLRHNMKSYTDATKGTFQ
jgi:hypothetical protein